MTRIDTEDDVPLAGGLMKGSGDDVVILGHPGTFTKYGWSLEAAGEATCLLRLYQ